MGPRQSVRDAAQGGLSGGQLRELGRQARSAAIWSFANTLFARFVGVATTAVLARLIAPEQFGVFAIALIVFNVVISVSEMGVSVALVRTTGDIRNIAPTVTTLAWASSGVLCLACMVGAPAFASAMDTPEATGLLQVIALGLPLAGLSAVPGAITQREFRQDRKAVAEGLAVIVGLVVALPLALAGYGAWSLAWSRLAGLLTTTVFLTVMTKERYRPGFDRAEARRLVAFGLPLAGSSLLVLAVLNVDYVVVGKVLGVEALGFYSLAFNISTWPVAAFSAPARNVSVAWLANLRDGGYDQSAGLAQLLRPLMALTIPSCVLISIMSGPLVAVLYGDQWQAVAKPLAVLAALGAFRVLLEVGYDSLVSAGRSRSILAIHAVWLSALTPTLILATRAGLVAVSWGHVLVVVGVVLPLYLVSVRSMGVSLRMIGKPLIRPMVGGAAMVLVGIVLNHLVSGNVAQLVACGVAGSLVYGAIVVRHPGELVTQLARMRGR